MDRITRLFFNRRYTLLFCFYIIFWIILGIKILLFFINSNPVKLTNNLKSPLFSLVPQGWAFFTRNPREAQIVLYQKQDSNSFTLFNTRNASNKFLFGIDRKASKIMAELQFAKSEINQILYYDTVFNYQNTVSINNVSKLIPYDFRNKLIAPSLCGEYIVVYQKPIPWAWSKNIKGKLTMPCKMIKINFICNDKHRK